MTITSPHNEQLKEIRKLAGRKWRDKLRQFVAEGEDLLDAADAAGWEPLARLVAEGSGLPGEEVKPHLLAQVSQLGSGTRALGVYAQRWAPAPTGPLVPGAVGRQRPRQRRDRAAGRARVRGGAASRSAPAPPTRTARRPCGRRWARCSRCRSCACGRWRSCRAAGSRWSHTAANRSLAHGDEVTLVVGAERSGLSGRDRLRVRRDRHDPGARRVAERRDGGNRRPVRVQP